MRLRYRALFASVGLSVSFAVAVVPTHADDGWTKTPNSRVRLNWCGKPEGPASPQAAAKPAAEFAYLELQLEPGWKTYWRTPGDSGVSPEATWVKSQNLARTAMSFPAPHRLADQGGESIGYKDRVVLPILIERVNTKAPVELATTLNFGVCKNICVPVEVDLMAACFDGGTSDDIATAIETVPRAPGHLRATDPKLVAVNGSVATPAPKLMIDIDFGVGSTDADLFLEAPDGLYVPLPARATADANGRARFVVDLSKTLDPKELLGKPLRLTMVSSKGASETVWVAK